MRVKKAVAFTVLLFIVVLTFSSFIPTFGPVSIFATGAPDKVVSNEFDLRNAVNNAPSGKSTVIALNNDIILTEKALNIPDGKEITLTSNKANVYYKLIGDDHSSTINVDVGGVLMLAGLVVSHVSGCVGRGVTVLENGRFIMYSGEVSGNTADGGYLTINRYKGGGVLNMGVFEMYGGVISGNTANGGDGAGVYNSGNFTLSDGKISGNSYFS